MYLKKKKIVLLIKKRPGLHRVFGCLVSDSTVKKIKNKIKLVAISIC